MEANNHTPTVTKWFTSKKTYVLIVAVMLLVQVCGLVYYFYGRRLPKTQLLDRGWDLNYASHLDLFKHILSKNKEEGKELARGGGGDDLEKESEALGKLHKSQTGEKEPLLTFNETSDSSGLPLSGNFAIVSPEIAKIYSRLKSAESRPLWNSGKTWDKGSFCDDFLLHTFRESVPVCGSHVKPTDSIKCFATSHDPTHMGTCVLENVAINPLRFSWAIKDGMDVNFNMKDTVTMLRDQDTSCPQPTGEYFKKKVEADAYQNKLVQHVVGNEKKSSSICKHWIDKPTFFFTAQRFHIYFRFLDYYNLHKSLWDHNVTTGDFLIIRISEDYKTRFPLDTDRALFPETITLQDLPVNDTVCFRKVITVPRCFSSILFRCKMNTRIRSKCFACDGKDLSGTPFDTFRHRILKACSVEEKDSSSHINTHPQLGVVSRTPYMRHPWDQLKNFPRMLTNENDLVSRLQKEYPTSNTSVLHPESYDICGQVRYAQKQDVLMGVHGAGMVHIWWLKNEALALELEPPSQRSNPTFKMLSTLAGRRYRSVSATGTEAKVSVDIGRVVREIKDNAHLPL